MRIRTFGGIELASATAAPVRLPTRRTALLLVALVLAGPKGARRAALSEAFWADRGEAQSRGSLRQALAAIRRAFPEGELPHVAGDLEFLRLEGKPEDVDAWLFDRLADDPSGFAAAAGLYQGDLLQGIALPPPLDQYFGPHQQSYRRKALVLAERLSERAGDEAAQAACQGLAERLLATDPAAEEAHRAMIRLYRHQGRANAAHRQFDLCREALKRELGVEPEAETLRLIGDTAASPAPVAPIPAAPPRDRDQPSVIVMPFDNLSGDADGYFVDGVVEEITAALSRVRDFFVIARQSAFAYKGRFVDVRDVGRELGVTYVVEGTVRRGGDRLRISVQLVNAETRTQLWSERYEGVTTDIFEFQDRIAAQVAGAMQPALRNAEIEFARRKPPGSLRAYDFVLQAFPKIWSQDAQDSKEAAALLRKALDAEPRYGRAHALLAWCHSQNVVYLWSSDPEHDRKSARAAVDAASGLIADDPTALTAVGAVFSQCLPDLDRAEAFIEAALALDPNNAWAWSRAAWVAVYRADPDRAMERFERSHTLSPLDPLEFNLRIGMAAAVGLTGDYAEAARLLREVLAKQPGLTWVYRMLSAYSALSGDLDSARAAIKTLRAAYPNATVATMRETNPGRWTPKLFNAMLEGWRLAGLPEN